MTEPSAVLSRVSPLPKKIEVLGAVDVAPSDLVLRVSGGDVWARRSARELADFVGALCGTRPPVTRSRTPKGKTVITLAPDSDRRTFADAFGDPYFDDFCASPGFQSYRVTTSGPPSEGLILQGLSPEGVYWGMKTLKQLIRFERDTLVLPLVRILDGADMEERGIWTQPFGMPTFDYNDRADAVAHYRRWIDWMSDHKLNLVEVVAVGENGGIGFRSKRHPEFCVDGVAEREYLLRNIAAYAATRGVRVVPVFTHGEHMDFISRKFPKLAAPHAISHHGSLVRMGVNFFHRKTAAVYLELAEELLALLDPRALCFWLAEDRLHCLPPGQQGRSEFLQEAELFYDVVKRLRRAKPDLGIKILLSQGSFPENLSLMRALPRDVQWIYYSGERFGTYNIRPRNPIHGDIATAAREGHWVSLCNALRGIPGRPTVLSRIHADIGHALDAGLQGLDGMSYSHPGDETALFVAAEHTWNYRGRSLDETLCSYAAEQGVAAPGRQGAAYRLYDDANFAHGVRNSPGIGQPFGDFSRYGNMLERIRDNDKVDELIMHVVDAVEDVELPALAKAEADLARALAIADPADELFGLRTRYLLHTVRISRSIVQAFYVNGREKCWDLYKGAWDDFRAALRTHLDAIQAEVTAAEPTYRKLVRLEQWSHSTLDQPDPLAGVAELARAVDVNRVTTSR